jgi:hypothetical protein
MTLFLFEVTLLRIDGDNKDKRIPVVTVSQSQSKFRSPAASVYDLIYEYESCSFPFFLRVRV